MPPKAKPAQKKKKDINPGGKLLAVILIILHLYVTCFTWLIALAATHVSGKVNNEKKNKGKEFFSPALSNAAPTPATFSAVPPTTTMAGAVHESAGGSNPAPKKRELEAVIPEYAVVEKKARRRSKGEMLPSDDQFDSIRLDGKLTVLELVELISSRLKLVFLFSPIVSTFFLFHQMVLVELAPAHGLSKPVLKHAWENQSVGTLYSPVIQRHVCVYINPLFE